MTFNRELEVAELKKYFGSIICRLNDREIADMWEAWSEEYAAGWLVPTYFSEDSVRFRVEEYIAEIKKLDTSYHAERWR